jgi:hypothetical protein
LGLLGIRLVKSSMYLDELMTLQAYPTMPLAVVSSTPPVNPVDGQEWFLAMSGGVYAGMWRFRWNASFAHWQFIGGPPWADVGHDYNNTNVPATFWPIVAAFPTFTAPRIGQYLFDFGGSMGDGNGTLAATIETFTFQLSVNAAAPIGNYISANVTGTWQASAAAGCTALTLAAGDVVHLRTSTNVAGKNMTAAQMFLKATPLYVT